MSFAPLSDEQRAKVRASIEARHAQKGVRPVGGSHKGSPLELRARQMLDEAHSGRLGKVGKFGGSVRGMWEALRRWRSARPLRKRGAGKAWWRPRPKSSGSDADDAPSRSRKLYRGARVASAADDVRPLDY